MCSLSQLPTVLLKHDYKQGIGMEMDETGIISVAVRAYVSLCELDWKRVGGGLYGD